MENTTIMWIIGCLLIGGIFGYVIMPTKEVQIASNCPEIPACNPVIVEKNISVDVPVEIEPDYSAKVVDALIDEVSSDKDFRYCDRHKYSADEISVKKVYDGFTYTVDDEDDWEISGVKVKLNYDDGDCYRTFVCELNSEDDFSCS